MQKAPGTKHLFLIGAGIFLATVLTFAVNVRNEFIRFDDYDYIINNVALADGLNRHTIRWAFTPHGYASNWHPLTWLSHAADISIAEALGIECREAPNDCQTCIKPTGRFAQFVHFENVLWHAANAVLLWLVMLTLLRMFNPNHKPETSNSKLSNFQTFKLSNFQTFKLSNFKFQTSNYLLAAFFALLWSLHPLRVEVVAWAAERKELLSVFFMLLTLLTYLRHDGVGRGGLIGAALSEKSTNSIVHLFSPPILSLSLFTLALLAKPVAVSLPAVLFAYDWVLRRRGFRESFFRVFPFACFAGATCLMTMFSQTVALDAGRDFTPLQKWLSVLEAPAVYLAQTAWPFGLSVDYPLPDWETWPYLIGGLLILTAIIVVCLFYVWKRTASPQPTTNYQPPSTNYHLPSILSLLVFAIAWAYVGLLPMIGIVKVGYEPHNDRYTYWIGCGVAVLAFGLVSRVLRKKFSLFDAGHLVLNLKGKRIEIRQIAAYAALAFLVAFAAFSVRQSGDWYDTESLFARAVEKTANPYFAWPLGEYMMYKGKERYKEVETMLWSVHDRLKTDETRAVLALHQASFGPGKRSTGGMSGVNPNASTGFEEARTLANLSMEDGTKSAKMWASAALGFADYRDRHFAQAYENMKRAIDLGYKSGILVVKLDEWKAKAEEERKGKEENSHGVERLK